MFHVRYYKTYNSHLYDENESLRKSLDTMRSEFNRDPCFVPIGDVMEFTPFDRSVDETRLFNGATRELECYMIGLFKWNLEKKSFDVTELRTIPTELSYNVELETSLPSTSSSKYDEIALQGFMDLLTRDSSTKNIANSNSGDDVSGKECTTEVLEHRAWYNQMIACVTEISKLCETKTDAKPIVLQKLREIQYNLRTDVHCDLKKIGFTEDVSKSSMVSSSFNQISSPNRGRYKAGYESNR
jgi:hypothetical protein